MTASTGSRPRVRLSETITILAHDALSVRGAGPRAQRAALLRVLVPVLSRRTGIGEENITRIVENAADESARLGAIVASDRAQAVSKIIVETLQSGSVPSRP